MGFLTVEKTLVSQAHAISIHIMEMSVLQGYSLDEFWSLSDQGNNGCQGGKI